MNGESSNEKGSAAVNPNGSTIPAQVQTSSGLVPSGASQHQAQNTKLPAPAAVTPNGIWAFTAQDVIAYIFQLVALAIALIFGAWAIKSYDAAEAANNLSLVQNKLALLAYCQSLYLGAADLIVCDGINQALALDSIASSLSISLPLPSTTATTSSTAVPTLTLSSTSSSGASSLPPSPTTISEPSSVATPSPVPPSSSAAESTTVLPGFPSSSSTSAPSTTASVSSSLPTATIPVPGATPTAPGNTVSSGVGLELGGLIGVIVGVVAFVGAIVGFWRFRRARRLSMLNSAA